MLNSVPMTGLSGVSIGSHCIIFFLLFWNSVCCSLSSASKSALATAESWPASYRCRKLCHRVPEHDKSNGHRERYLALRDFTGSVLLK